MLFTWDTKNLCIVFPSWRVTGTLSLLVSLLAVVALTAGYEAIREVSRRYEERLAANVQDAPRKSLPPHSSLFSPIGILCTKKSVWRFIEKTPPRSLCLRMHFPTRR